VLNLSENRITEAGFIHITPHLLPSLLDLDVSVNAIGNKGVASLAQFLRRSDCRLKRLNISSNQLRDMQVTKVLKALELNSSVEELDVSYNLWEDGGAAAIGSLLVRSPMCCTLHLPFFSQIAFSDPLGSV
jgi:Leucine-rich repeat (LRR) protein